MMMTFAEQIRAALAKANEGANSQQAQPFLEVLKEFVAEINTSGVGARIQPGRTQQKLSFYIYPQHRPGRANLMLSFFLNGDTIVVSGESTTTLSTAEDLQQWLLKFLQLPAFVESLAIMREQARIPVEARLRAARDDASVESDIGVAVSPEDQERLDKKQKGETIEVTVTPFKFPGNRSYVPGTNYFLLESAGLSVDVQQVTPQEEKLVVTGTRA